MDIETRVANLEKLVNSLVELISKQKFYTDADINGVRNSVTEITPYIETKSAYYGEKEKTFYGVPSGIISVNFDNYTGDYTITKVVDRVTVSFGALEQKTDITISII